MEGTNVAITLDKGNDAVFVRAASLNGSASFLPVVSLINLNDLARTAKRAFGLRLHRFAQSVHHEPRRFVRNLNRAVKLMRRETLFAGRHEMRGENPFVERDFGVLEHRTNGYCEMTLAVVALAKRSEERRVGKECRL